MLLSGAPSPLRRAFGRFACAALAGLGFAALLAQPGEAARRYTTDALLGGPSSSGSFLAGRLAYSLRDNEAAAGFYEQALRANPNNLDLLDRAFLACLTSGQIDKALRYADRLTAIDRGHRIGQLALGVKALRARRYSEARDHFALGGKPPVLDLMAPLLSAWAFAGAGDTAKGVLLTDAQRGPEWYTAFRDLSDGMMLDLAGDHDKAVARLQAAAGNDPSAVRVVEALARAQARAGKRDDALKTLMAFDAKVPNHPIIAPLIADIRAGRSVRPSVDSAQEGAADILIGLAGPLAKQGGSDYALVFYQLALSLQRTDAVALVGLGELFSDLKQPEQAADVLSRVPQTSPFKRNAEIELAVALDQQGRTDEAITHLNRLVQADPKDLEAITALGSLYQARKRWPEAADAFTRAVAAVGTPTAANWSLFYFRGIAMERSKQWSKAEADFKQALKLSPDQPSVLNYLGYSWIEQGVNYDQGLAMIRKAVDQRPEDGYIVDSLGWAYFKLGRFDEAVRTLESAVALKPGDPTINDHLGDAYWRSGRKLEAVFQWNHARDSKPEPADLARIQAKIKDGLKDEGTAAVVPKTQSDAPTGTTPTPATQAGQGG